jgi:hypothetical protein
VGALSLIGFGAFVGAALAAGARLLWVARRTRDGGALAIGGSLALTGAGYAAMVAAFRLGLVRESSLGAAFALGNALLALGLLVLLVGVWRVFRPQERWPVGLVVAGAAALVASWVRGATSAGRSPFVFWTFNATAVAAYAWCAVECLRARAALRRRALLGLVDAAVGRRLLAWGAAASASAGLFAAGMVGRLLVAGPHPGVQLGQSLAALVAGVATCLAFLPPTRSGVAADADPGSPAESLLRRVRGG